eukprot:CAMPEP_0184357372 /NCGR_PEP_ID=MMETSP1089-20130417/108431_1 /TAXON_ID=38269 ORGANISM="Gloeochaete wittrockiana, Strain SAG46.84" /NCGR_SAMPLE_ID=MMETSP1089 /ASSEMBLY_ACC=CAM_ASM_000445 /LENGTH=237 /DNA_ID=CAMNT_0026695125 /DNA_START=39 /DNA_END=752 /DNA_ORIENTATION=+
MWVETGGPLQDEEDVPQKNGPKGKKTSSNIDAMVQEAGAQKGLPRHDTLQRSTDTIRTLDYDGASVDSLQWLTELYSNARSSLSPSKRRGQQQSQGPVRPKETHAVLGSTAEDSLRNMRTLLRSSSRTPHNPSASQRSPQRQQSVKSKSPLPQPHVDVSPTRSKPPARHSQPPTITRHSHSQPATITHDPPPELWDHIQEEIRAEHARKHAEVIRLRELAARRGSTILKLRQAPLHR